MIKLYATETKIIIAEELEIQTVVFTQGFYLLKHASVFVAQISKQHPGKMDFGFNHFFIPLLINYAELWKEFKLPMSIVLYSDIAPPDVARGYDEYRMKVTASLSGIHIAPAGGDKNIPKVDGKPIFKILS